MVINSSLHSLQFRSQCFLEMFILQSQPEGPTLFSSKRCVSQFCPQVACFLDRGVLYMLDGLCLPVLLEYISRLFRTGFPLFKCEIQGNSDFDVDFTVYLSVRCKWIKAGVLSVAQAHLTVVVKRLCKINNLPAVQSWIFSLHFEQVLCTYISAAFGGMAI